MPDLTPHALNNSLDWADFVLDLQERALERGWHAYIVGGAVRDAYRRRPLKDIDLVTPDSGMKLARQIADTLGGAYYPLDAERDIGRALIDRPDGRIVIDVSRFRGADLLADLSDRDFTVNAIAVDLAGDLDLVIDPLDGAGDLQRKLLRQCHPDSITRDPVRALRAVRQSVQLGLSIGDETRIAIRTAAPLLADTSAERIRDEFFKILALPKPAMALRVAEVLGLIAHVLPEWVAVHPAGMGVHTTHTGEHAAGGRHADAWSDALLVVERMYGIWNTISPARTDATAAQFALGMLVMALDRYRPSLQAHIAHMWPDERPHRALLLLAGLLSPFGAEIAAERGRALKLSSAEVERVSGMIAHAPLAQTSETTPLAIYRFWREAGSAGVDGVLFNLAQYLAAHATDFSQDAWLAEVARASALLGAYYERHDQVVEPPALVNGRDLQQELGLKPGELFGRLLEAIREAQVTGEVHTHEEALEYARLYIAHRGG